MAELAVMRHAPTLWNEEGRIQGRTDVPLSAAGRAGLAGRRLPADLAAATCMCSPLMRCRETARLLGARDVIVEPRLIETSWGAWEGRRAKELDGALRTALAGGTSQRLDFRPPGGESPRDVQARLLPWLTEVGAAGRAVTAVSHKGVIQALYAMATGWDMDSPRPHKLDWAGAHLFAVDATGTPEIVRLNIALDTVEAPA